MCPRLSGSSSHRERWTVRLAGLALALATPVATWWAIGDQSTVPASMDPDFLIRPLAIGAHIEFLVGVGALLVAVVASATLLWASRTRWLDQRWWFVLLPLLAAGLLVGAGWRVMTAGVIGANIGAGLVVLFGGPLLTGLLLWAAGWSIYLMVRAR